MVHLSRKLIQSIRGIAVTSLQHHVVMDYSRLAQVVRSSPSSKALYVFEGVDFDAFLELS